MAKSQKKSNKEVRKPKAEKEPKANASNPTTKGKPVEMTTLKRSGTRQDDDDGGRRLRL